MPGKRKRKPIQYDYEIAYPNELDKEEMLIRDMLKKGKIKSTYATKEIESGNLFEVEIYPEFTKASQIPAAALCRSNWKAQRNLNDKNARKYFVRLVCSNFTMNDIRLDLTYADDKYPKDLEEAKKNMQNFIKRVNRLRKKHGLGNARYVYITEQEDAKVDENGAVLEEIRYHHHLIMDGELGRDLPESKWKHGGRNQARYLEPDDYELTGLASYLSKAPKGEKRWCSSTNLKKPIERVNHYKFRKKHVDEMVDNQDVIEEYMCKRYQDHRFLDATVYHNNVNASYYISVRMRKRGDPG